MKRFESAPPEWSEEHGKTLAERLARYPGATVVAEHDGCVDVHIPVSDERRAIAEADLAQLTEAIEYWRAFVERAEAAGAKVWSRDDFEKGDLVAFGSGWFEVVRVNAKTLTVPALILHAGSQNSVFTMELMRQQHARGGWTDTVAYDKVHARLSAAEALERFPGAFADASSDSRPPRPSKKRGKVKLEHSPGAEWEGWWFELAGERYYIRWMWPERWLDSDASREGFCPVADAEAFRSTGIVSKVKLATIAIPGRIHYVEQVHNGVRAWVEQFAQRPAADASAAATGVDGRES